MNRTALGYLPTSVLWATRSLAIAISTATRYGPMTSARGLLGVTATVV